MGSQKAGRERERERLGEGKGRGRRGGGGGGRAPRPLSRPRVLGTVVPGQPLDRADEFAWVRRGSDAELATNLAQASTDLRCLLTQNRVDDKAQAILFKAKINTIAKFSASFTSEDDLREVLKDDSLRLATISRLTGICATSMKMASLSVLLPC